MGRILALLVALASACWSQPTMASMVQDTLTACNQVRQQHGLNPLQLNESLCRVARQHSLEMDRLGYFSHHSPLPEFADLVTRMNREGCYQLTCGENLFRSENYPAAQLPAMAVRSWLQSATHRKNLLNGRYNLVGLGLTQRGGTFTLTQNLAYDAVRVTEKTVTPTALGYRINLRCTVADGPTSGAVFYAGKRCLNWQASPQGDFVLDFEVPGAGPVSIAQTVAEREWMIETEIDLHRGLAGRPGPVASK